MYKPGATYRIQFHKGFNFDDFENILPYLYRLGIKTVYASPIFQAVTVSTHGYDGTDPNVINPEIGTLEQFRKIAAELKKYGMGWLQDFAPNHMAFSPENAWLVDYLEKGKMSEYDTFFDKNPHEQLMVPFLGTTLEEAMAKQQIKIVYKAGKLQLQYFDVVYPLNYTGYFDIVNHETFEGIGIEAIRAKLELLSQIMNKEEFALQWNEVLNELDIFLKDKKIRTAFEKGLEHINRNHGILKEIVDVQFYRLCFWKETNHKINYRRFFTVNGLICLNMQLDNVFDTYHQLLNELITDDLIQGIRIDHIDGLYDPYTYLKKLRQLVGPDVYIIVEKILGRDESLLKKWNIQGTSGYDFLSKVNNVLSDEAGGKQLVKWYERKTGKASNALDDMHIYKRKFLYDYMQGEWNNLFNDFSKCVKSIPQTISAESLKNIIAAVLVYCPVYRFYFDAIPFAKQNLKTFETLMGVVKKASGIDPVAFDFFIGCFTNEDFIKHKIDKKQLLHFWRRCMQMTGPLMAKGVEDTFMYNDAIYLAQNEVGDSPIQIGLKQDDFHEWMQVRQQYFPISLSATATHDTKRGEDGRARLQLISSHTKEWLHNANIWMDDADIQFSDLSVDEKYFVIQSVYAALDSNEKTEDFEARLKSFLTKAAREAKLHSDWDTPDEAYENKLYQYALYVLNNKEASIHSYISSKKTTFVTNALVQLVLKCTCPGTPDFYQGTESWDFSFVDPDNRRPVDFDARIKMLDKINAADFKLEDILKNIEQAGIKLYAAHKLLQTRIAMPQTFDDGLYQPISISEKYLSYIRRYGEDWIIVVLPLGGKPIHNKTSVSIPDEAPLHWINIFTNAMVEREKLHIEAELKQFPVLVLKSVKDASKRKAGILLPLFSLPSDYGIGGMGREAYEFIRFLSKGRQRIWQQLPLNPTLKENFYSPYASSSSFAGDPVYIDPERLLKDGLLTSGIISEMNFKTYDELDYAAVKHFKESILRETWTAFKSNDTDALQNEFENFCNDEAKWLDIYAIYVVIKKDQEELAWYKWPKALKDKDSKALLRMEKKYADELGFQKWMQFLFFRQWKALKQFAHQMNVAIMGDLPFYVSYDSADVWANRNYFDIDDHGKMLHVAGVPPDYFSANGQAWGMPTYNWKAQQEHKFEWWLNRLAHQTALFDLVRLDHFRAFFDYWEIPAKAENAVHGEWRKGPQEALFDLMKERFPTMPFIAEDLGEMHQGVFDFRDKYDLMGMRVLQFGFENYRPISNDLPHNFKCASVVYTGTHDNNTLQGWYKQLPKSFRKDLQLYMGIQINKENVAKALIDMAYSSVAILAIIPLQDILNLDETNRINVPSTVDKNWLWRLKRHQLNATIQTYLSQLSIRYYR